MFAFAALIPILATLSVATPLGRQTAGSLCPATGSSDAKNFTLVAIDTANATVQKPLALGSSGWIATAESISSITAKDFDMANGGITAYGSDGSIAGVSNTVSQNGPLSFTDSQDASPSQGYCEMFSTSAQGSPGQPPNSLSVNLNGDFGDNFSLCQGSNCPEYVVIYDAVDSGATEYIFSTCKSVRIAVVPVDGQ